jgi:lipid A 3-O-deacylase
MNARGLLYPGAIALGLALAAPATAQAPAPAPAPANDGSTWTLQMENDSFSLGTKGSTDKYYSDGLRLGWTTPTRLVPDSLKGLATSLWGQGETRLSVDVTHQIYTPILTQRRNPPLTDRPYAGVLMGHFGLLQDGKTQTGYDIRSALVLGVGVVGPAAGGASLQNGFHELIGQRQSQGWSTQLKNEPLLQITSERTWRIPVAKLGPLETDFLPSLTASAGNLRAYLQSGVMIRLGQGLQADYGPARLRPGVTGGDHYNSPAPLAWYVFAGADGRAVARDLTLDGNTWATSRSVRKIPFVGEASAGLGVIYHGVRLTYVHRLQTQEFRHQSGGLHQTGSLALSVRF